MTTNINNSPKYACRTCMKQQCGCKDTESALPCHFYTEQPKQEPVAWALSHSIGLEFGSKYPIQETKEAAEQMARQHMGAVVVTPLYAAPVRTKDLTDEEATDVAYKGFNDYWTEDCKGIEAEAWLASARAVIAAFKAKNAAPVRTKDLTDEELWEAAKTAKSNDLTDAFRAVIAADREKNK